jgi:hypothetical protein
MLKKIGDAGPIKVVEIDELKDVDVNDFDSKKKLADAKKNLIEKESDVK